MATKGVRRNRSRSEYAWVTPHRRRTISTTRHLSSLFRLLFGLKLANQLVGERTSRIDGSRREGLWQEVGLPEVYAGNSFSLPSTPCSLAIPHTNSCWDDTFRLKHLQAYSALATIYIPYIYTYTYILCIMLSKRIFFSKWP